MVKVLELVMKRCKALKDCGRLDTYPCSDVLFCVGCNAKFTGKELWTCDDANLFFKPRTATLTW